MIADYTTQPVDSCTLGPPFACASLTHDCIGRGRVNFQNCACSAVSPVVNPDTANEYVLGLVIGNLPMPS